MRLCESTWRFEIPICWFSKADIYPAVTQISARPSPLPPHFSSWMAPSVDKLNLPNHSIKSSQAKFIQMFFLPPDCSTVNQLIVIWLFLSSPLLSSLSPASCCWGFLLCDLSRWATLWILTLPSKRWSARPTTSLSQENFRWIETRNYSSDRLTSVAGTCWRWCSHQHLELQWRILFSSKVYTEVLKSSLWPTHWLLFDYGPYLPHCANSHSASCIRFVRQNFLIFTWIFWPWYCRKKLVCDEHKKCQWVHYSSCAYADTFWSWSNSIGIHVFKGFWS